jgi:hypothetical protein
VAETGTSESGTWSVTLSGLYPQPEMELRLVFPPTEDGADTEDLKTPRNEKGDKGGSPKKQGSRRTPSPLDETNSVDYILTFKNKQANNRRELHKNMLFLNTTFIFSFSEQCWIE